MDENLRQLAVISSLVSSHELNIKITKFEVAKDEVELLGHAVSIDGAAVNTEKIEAISAVPVPESGTALRSFLELT